MHESLRVDFSISKTQKYSCRFILRKKVLVNDLNNWYLDWMIDDKIWWTLWVDIFGIASELFDSISHGSKINNSWDTSKILEDNSTWKEWDLNTCPCSLKSKLKNICVHKTSLSINFLE